MAKQSPGRRSETPDEPPPSVELPVSYKAVFWVAVGLTILSLVTAVYLATRPAEMQTDAVKNSWKRAIQRGRWASEASSACWVESACRERRGYPRPHSAPQIARDLFRQQVRLFDAIIESHPLVRIAAHEQTGMAR
jgi:hypothetical protein